MIRINLLAAEKERGKKKAAAVFGTTGQKLTIGCSTILVLAVAFVSWRYWSLSRQSTALDAEISAAQQETQRLHSVILQVQQFEQRKAQLQQRVVLIEQLRKGQTGPVHMLDQVSRSLPPMLWLTELKQKDDDVVIDGRTTVLTSLTDFVTNLEASGYFKKSIDIVNTTTEAGQGNASELIKFTIKASFAQPESKAPAPGGRGARAGG
jgi:type IV pilus assembly protein PilN